MSGHIKNMNVLIELFIRLANKVNELEKTPRSFGTDTVLHPSEIHTVDVIGRNQGINVTALAKKLGVTKGAASQMLTRLTRKDLVKKTRDAGNDKELILELTPDGWTAFEGHQEFHREMFESINHRLGHVTPEQMGMLVRVLDSIDEHLSIYLEDI
ncbi:MAG: MarR family winged helix-turn-helix transcriptional regulator [Candidatus Saccharibacteria bacterium]